jgi:hypothetical protein
MFLSILCTYFSIEVISECMVFSMGKKSAFSRVDEALLWEFVNIIHRKDIYSEEF